MSEKTGLQVTFVTINEDHLGQRIDNFLITHLKGVPKSAIYKLLRKGEVRVNKKRIKPVYKLQLALIYTYSFPWRSFNSARIINLPNRRLLQFCKLLFPLFHSYFFAV